MRYLLVACLCAAGGVWFASRGEASDPLDMTCKEMKGKDWIQRCESQEAVCFILWKGDFSMQCRFK
jgi:hypothetical protein